jgi:predicted N-acetyltransferase YhbS
MITRELARDEIDLIWSIDRAEVIDRVYTLRDGVLVLVPEHYNMAGWPRGTREMSAPVLHDCFDQGGWFCGAFDGAVLAGVAVLESRFIGAGRDRLQLVFLHVSRAYRDRGIGGDLFRQAMAVARGRGARKMYVSATPSEHTIDFYLRQGCRVTPEPDPELFALEPEDIHLECALQ